MFRVLIIAFVFGTVSGCGEHSSSGSKANLDEGTPSATSVAPSEPPADFYKQAATFSYTNRDGDRAEGAILLAGIQSAAQADFSTGSTMATECINNWDGITPSRSLVVPFRITVKLVSALPAPLKVAFQTPAIIRSSPRPECTVSNFGGFYYLVNMSEARPATDYVYDGFIVVGNVISPNYPQGDPEKMADVGLAPYFGIGALIGKSTDLSGPNVCNGAVYVTKPASGCQ
jgi:hypothetical protein